MSPVIIGDATLYLGDCRDILPTLPKVDAVIVDPPYSERCHSGHDAPANLGVRDSVRRSTLGYESLSPKDAHLLADEYSRICGGWIVWMTDHTLAPVIMEALQKNGRYVFAPLPFFQPGRSVRLTGDGPSSWTDWIIVARTKAQIKWGTLPGGYVAGPGWDDKERIGGKPTILMHALVAHYSRRGDTVLDTHMGSGTTGVACAKAGRSFIGCEIDGRAFDLACHRIEEAQRQMPMFDSYAPKAEQLALGVEP